MRQRTQMRKRERQRHCRELEETGAQADGWEPHPGLFPLSDKQLRRKSRIISSGHARQDERFCLLRKNL